MKPVADMSFNPTSEQLVQVLCQKTQNDNPLFFRVLVAYYFGVIASMMRCTIQTHDRGPIPVNLYALALSPSGSGKGHSTNIIEQSVIHLFRQRFLEETFPLLAEINLAKIASKRAAKKGTDPDDELRKVEKEFHGSGPMLFNFDSGTPAAVKQMRHKLLLADAGAMNLMIDECYTPETEVMTQRGYIRFDALLETDLVCQFDAISDTINFVQPTRYISKHYTGKIHKFQSSAISQFVTENHEMLTYTPFRGYMKVKAKDVTSGMQMPTCGTHTGNFVFTDEHRLALAIQADGTIRSHGGVELAFKKERKINRLIYLLGKLNIPYSTWQGSQGHTHFYLSGKNLTGITLSKDLTDLFTDVTTIGTNAAKQILEELVQWDGSINKNLPNIKRFTCKYKKNVSLVQVICTLAGYRSTLHSNNKAGYKGGYYVNWNESHANKYQLSALATMRTVEDYSGMVYCVTVPSGALVIRHNGKVSIGGNCGTNLLSNTDVLATYLELFDVGAIKTKLIKNTAENVRSEEIHGRTPTNVLMFGTPSRLLNGSKTEEELYTMLDTGYARRLFFGYVRSGNVVKHQTPEQVYENLTNQANIVFIDELAQKLEVLADMVNVNKQLTMSKDTALQIIEYKMMCDAEAAELPEHEEIKKAEITHRYYKALKLAGAYAFIEQSPTVTTEHFYQAVKLAEESGGAFHQLLTRDRAYVKLAKYIASTRRDVTQADLVEDLPFYKGGIAQKTEMMNLAVAYGYRNNMIIKRSISDGIEFFKGETLQPTNMQRMIVSYGKELAENYRNEFAPWDGLHRLTQAPGMHWVAHHLVEGYRNEESCIAGFNLVVVDVDGGTDISTAELLLKPYKYLLYTTKRHTDNEHRFRIIFPTNFQLTMDAKDYKEFMNAVYEWLPFDVDKATNQRSRKWLTNPGFHKYNEGEPLDVLPFIPKTSKNEERKNLLKSQQSLDNLERWFINGLEQGNRNNLFHRYAMTLVDAGFGFDDVRKKVLALNEKIPDKLDEVELTGTVLVTVAKALAKL